jgi:hypothetical protein
VAVENMLIFGILYILLSTLIGLTLAILLDQKIRNEGVLRTIYLYPMAISFIVTGVIWQWILNPGLGIQTFMRNLGFETFTFDWLVQNDYGHLLRGDRRSVAGVGLHHGPVPGRAARHQHRHRERGQDRRRKARGRPTAMSFCRSCGRCSSRPSWCRRTWRSRATTWSWR